MSTIHWIITGVVLFALSVVVYGLGSLRYISRWRKLTGEDYFMAGIHCFALLVGCAVLLSMW